MRPVVLLDVDGVLADFIGATIDGARAQLRAMGYAGTADLLPSETDRWDIKGCLADAVPDAAAEVRIAVNATWRQPGLAYGLAAYPGAVDGVYALREVADVVAITAPLSSNPTWSHERDKWLQDLFGFVGTGEDIIITGAKWRVPGDLLVEDRPETLDSWRKRWPGVGVLVDRPYNRGADMYRMTLPGCWPGLVELAKVAAEGVLR